MPLVLAIEPDRRQAAHLTAIVCHQVGAELLLADTTEGALDAIGDRVPDLVLVPALLSPQDDAALAAALRVIAAAAHVRTLTIPVLAAQSASEEKSGGLFSRWRKGSSASQALDGCDPALFAEQIIAYLKESAAERAQLAEQEAAAQRRAAREKLQGTTAPAAPAEPVADVPPDLAAFTEVDEPAYQQPEMPAAAYSRTDMPSADAPVATPPAYAEMQTPAAARDDAFSRRGDEVYPRADAEIYTPSDTPVPVYTPDYSFATAQASAAVPEPATVVHEEPQHHADAYASSDAASNEHEDYSALLHDQLVAHLNGSHYDAPPAEAARVALPDAEEEDDIDLSGELEGLEGETAAGTNDDEFFDGEKFGVYTMPTLVDEPEIELRPAPVSRNRFRAEPPPAPDPAFFIEPEEQPRVEAVAARSKASKPPARVSEPETWAAPAASVSTPTPRASTTPSKPVGTPRPAPAPAPPPPAAPKRDRPEWSELVASLRKDIERRRVDPPKETPKPKPAPAPAPVQHAAGAAEVPVPVARRARKAKPIQDEWGFFDPEQCGFAALLAKLDEITEGAEEPEVRQTR